jgi:predicted nucleic acid-binding protein
MRYYLDTVVVIYAVEGAAVNQLRARNHLAALERAGHRFVVSEFTRLECLVPTFAPGAAQRLLEFLRFFHTAVRQTVLLTAAMHDRAAAIRGAHRYPAATASTPLKRSGMADALRLAAAIESDCDRFRTNDNQLAGFPDIAVEVLP